MVESPLDNAEDERGVGSSLALEWGHGISDMAFHDNFWRGHGSPLQCSCLESPMDRGAWGATVHKVTKGKTRLKCFSPHVRIQIKGVGASVKI